MFSKNKYFIVIFLNKQNGRCISYKLRSNFYQIITVQYTYLSRFTRLFYILKMFIDTSTYTSTYIYIYTESDNRRAKLNQYFILQNFAFLKTDILCLKKTKNPIIKYWWKFVPDVIRPRKYINICIAGEYCSYIDDRCQCCSYLYDRCQCLLRQLYE